MKGSQLIPYYCKKCKRIVTYALPQARAYCPACGRWVQAKTKPERKGAAV